MSVITTEAALPLDTLPALRLLPVPSSEPPYDDELPARPATARAPLGPLIALAPPALRLVPTPGGDLLDDDHSGPRRTPASELPPARPVAQALVQGLLEVVAGVRPVSQLQRGTSPELFERLEHLVHGRPRPEGARPGTGAVRSIHVQQQADGVAEVCATVRRGPRFATVALRLEGIRGRWCCTDVVGL
jgi:hypothetical protein